uniref:catechol O-methyltransferase n=1 Tax=Ciona savignyi TaxID=51511 RepID=H2YNB5_CIOSA
MNMDKSGAKFVPSFPGELLLYPSLYGPEEYFVCFLAIFIGFVAIKHLIFHTGFFWWYRSGQFYIPNRFWSFVTGKPLSKRLIEFVHKKLPNKEEKKMNIEDVLSTVDVYFSTKEFGPSLSNVKGQVVDDLVETYKPQSVLVVGCYVGYVLLRILRKLPRSARVFVIEPNQEYIDAAKSLVKMVGSDGQVTFISAEAVTVIPTFAQDYAVSKFDFVFLNRTKHNAPSHVSLLKLLEGNTKGDSYLHQASEAVGDAAPKTVVLADKVVLLGDPEFLKYVRGSPNYQTQYYQMSLEHTDEEIIDGMEKAVFVG